MPSATRGVPEKKTKVLDFCGSLLGNASSPWNSWQPSGRLLWGLFAGVPLVSLRWLFKIHVRVLVLLLRISGCHPFLNLCLMYLPSCACGYTSVVRYIFGISVFFHVHCKYLPGSVHCLLLFSKTFMFHMKVLYFYVAKYIIFPSVIISSFTFMKRPVSIYFLRHNLHILTGTGAQRTAHCAALTYISL